VVYTVEKVEIDSIDKTTKPDIVVAVELMIPRGGMIAYGLLGAEYTFIPQNKLNVKINVATEPNTPLVNPLVSSDCVLKGISSEYVEGIIQGIRVRNIPPGNITFSCGAHGLVGSSTQVFNILARIIIAIINSSYSERNETQLIELVNLEVMN
jgi:hypothetical protein